MAELGLEDEAYFAPLADLEAFQRQLHADVGLSKVTLTVALTNPNPNPGTWPVMKGGPSYYSLVTGYCSPLTTHCLLTTGRARGADGLRHERGRQAPLGSHLARRRGGAQVRAWRRREAVGRRLWDGPGCGARSCV